MTLIRVLRTVKTTLTRTFYLEEVATAATGNVVVTITRLDGTVVQTGNATVVGTLYSFVFNGSDTLDQLIVSWAATVAADAVVLDQDVLEVVGGFYFGLSEARAIDPKFTNATNFPTQTLIDRRNEVEDEAEVICEQAFVPRFARETLSGAGTSTLMLKHALLRRARAITVDGVAFSQLSVDAFAADEVGVLRYNTAAANAGVWPPGVKNIVVEYEHGMDRAPTAIVRGAKLRMKSLLLAVQSPMMDRAERVVTVDQSGGTVVYGSPGPGRTGIPETDAAYGKYPSPRPGFG